MRLLVIVLGCAGAPVDTSVTTVGPGVCGDGAVDADEACDDGAANADGTPDACRSDCRLPACGDGVVDGGEGCDDGETWGGDGCDPACGVEEGQAETEPNDTWDAAEPGPTDVDGALPAADVDCWSLAVPSCGAVRATETAPCTRALTLALHDPTGALVAAGGPGADGCARLDPAEEPGARWIAAGTWAVCASATAGAEVRGYALTLESPDPAGLDAPAVGGDLDADGIPDSCDADLDADGIDNATDDCPTVSNGPATAAPTLDGGGFVIGWLGAGPYTTGSSTGDCRPSDDPLAGEDAALDATIGSPAGDLVWTAQLVGRADFDLLTPYGGVDPPREAYALVYLRSETARALTLAVGADDGVFAWWNGARVLDVASCQGITADQFQAPVDVVAGWNTLLLKVRDQGGGWDVAARLLDAGVPVTDLEPSLMYGASWTPDQADADGDGVGDACDPSP